MIKSIKAKHCNGRTNKHNCRVSELIPVYKYISLNNILSKCVAKLLKYKMLFKYIITFLGPDYRVASLVTLYYIVLGISFTNQIKRIII